MSKMISIALVLGLAACSKSSSGGADGDPCAASIGKAIEAMISSRKGPPEAQEQMKAIGEKLRGVMVASCQADKWSADVLSCFATATDQPSIKACRGKLPPEQAQHLQAEIMKVMTGAMGAPGGGGSMHGGGGMAPPAPAPAGSAAP